MKPMALRHAAVVALVLALAQALVIAAAQAAPLFGVRADDSGSSDAIVAATPVSTGYEFFSPIVSGNFYFRTSSGVAERGYLQASSHGSIFMPDQSLFSSGSIINRSESVAVFRLDDVIISGPANVNSVTTVLNLHLDGSLSTNTFARNRDAVGNEATANAEITVAGSVGGWAFQGIQARSSVYNVGSSPPDRGSFFEDGILAGWAGGDIHTPELTLPVNTPFVLQLSLATFQDTTTQLSGAGGLPAERKSEAAASFGHTLSFSYLGPVFDLPAGYTANSVSGLIADNGWVAPFATPVPEPGSCALLLAGLAMMGWRARRRRAPSAAR